MRRGKKEVYPVNILLAKSVCFMLACIFNILCLMFLCFCIDYHDLRLQTVGTVKSVSFLISIGNNLLIKLVSVFTFFYSACDE